MKPAFDPLAQRYASAPADTQEGPAVAAKEDAKKPGGSCDLPGLCMCRRWDLNPYAFEGGGF